MVSSHILTQNAYLHNVADSCIDNPLRAHLTWDNSREHDLIWDRAVYSRNRIILRVETTTVAWKLIPATIMCQMTSRAVVSDSEDLLHVFAGDDTAHLEPPAQGPLRPQDSSGHVDLFSTWSLH